jgi:hypothetical protein
MRDYNHVIKIIVTLLSLSIKMYSQETAITCWIFSEKAYVINDTTKIHDTIACLQWHDSVLYYSSQDQRPNQKQLNDAWWIRIGYKNQKGWIKVQDLTDEGKTIEGERYKAYLQQPIQASERWYMNLAILDKKNRLKKIFPLEFDNRGQWLSPNKYLFISKDGLILYNVRNDRVKILDSAQMYILNSKLGKIVYINERSYETNYKYRIEISLKSRTFRGGNKECLYKITDGSQLRSGEEYFRCDLKIDKFMGVPCYSFRITKNLESNAQVFIDWKGKYLATIDDNQ